MADGYDFEIILGVRTGTYICYEDGGGFEYDPRYRPNLTLNANQSFSVVRNLGEGMEPGSGNWTVEMDEFGDEYVILNVTSSHWEDNIREYYLWIDAQGDLKLENRMGLTYPSAFFIYDN